MERLNQIRVQDQHHLSGDSTSLSSTSVRRVSVAMGKALLQMMAETQARYPNQMLPKGTPDMFLAQWEETAVAFGMETFRAGLLKAIRDSKFFPDPYDINAHCQAIEKERRAVASAKKVISELEDSKAQWLREREEDIANGIERAPLPSTSISKEICGASAKQRTAITGWTARELREAADELEMSECAAIKQGAGDDARAA